MSLYVGKLKTKIGPMEVAKMPEGGPKLLLECGINVGDKYLLIPKSNNELLAIFKKNDDENSPYLFDSENLQELTSIIKIEDEEEAEILVASLVFLGEMPNEK